jgi:hypothetical protein
MIMRINWDTPVSELYHSDSDIRYIDLDEDELMHWKYIKREKVNGKWRYYYDIGEKEKHEADVATRAASRYAKTMDTMKREYDKVNAKVNSGEYFDKDHGNQDIIQPYEDLYKSSRLDYERAISRAKKAVAAYEKTPLYKLEKARNKIKKGTKAIKNLFAQVKANLKSSFKTLGKKKKK